jgi:hypothetical protein
VAPQTPHPRHRWRAPLGLLALAVLAAGSAWLAPAALRPVPLHEAAFRGDPGLWRGAYHVHTTASRDGHGTRDDVARAARASGLLWVLLSDHNIVEIPPPEYREGVLLVSAVEVSTRAGHVVLLGASRGLERPERRGEAPLPLALRLGAAPVAAHPLNRRRPYRDLGNEALAGLEVLSLDDGFREALRSPPALLRAALVLPFNAGAAIHGIVPDPSPGLRRWDEGLAAGRRLVGACALDAHGRPAYDGPMRVLSMHALAGRPPAGDAEADAAALLDALRQGRAFCSVEAEAAGGGFRFVAREEGADEERGMGDAVRLERRPQLRIHLDYDRLPPALDVRLVCGGRRVSLDRRDDGRLHESRPRSAGACRAEVWVDRRPWILSNPIEVR